MKKYGALLAAIVGGLLLAIWATTPPSARPADAPETLFSASRAMEDVRTIAAEPHPTGSAQNAEVRAYIIARLQSLGMEVTTTTGLVPERGLDKFGHWSGTRPDSLTFTNIIGVLPGKDRTLPAVAIMSHHDTVWASPGAPDDTAGVAATMETIRAINAQGGAERDIVAIITDAEELGLNGARQFFAENPLRERIGAVINLEARGGGGRTTLFQTSSDNGEAVAAYAAAVDRPAGSSLSAFVYEVLPNDTDLTPALEGPYTAYNLAFIGRSGLYHSPKATPDNLDQGALQDMGDQTLQLTRALASSDAHPGKTPNATFFDVFGLFTMAYGAIAGWVLLIATMALHAGAYLRREKGDNPLKALGASLGVIVGGGILLYVFNLVSGAGGEANYYDRLAAIPRLEVQALLLSIAVLAATSPWWAGRNYSVVGLVLALAAHFFAPTTSYLIVWPLLIAGLAGVAVSRVSDAVATPIKIVAGAVIIGFLLQYGHQLMQGVGPDYPSLVALIAALALPVLGLLVPEAKARPALGLAGICLLTAFVIALWVRLDPVADTVAAYASLK
ncbi:M20/M25/M40 family metallo-hydrolase [Parerythrobacter jejuensis]|uniref:Vacuolar membrane protease n=1 Tax=Parerythrobacter jejuensis TaxID=795812 RepID=A0A845AZW5_9SPHN|nr:M20/M25/M40 family metallo-hydrolase [Parerythrobacter jejuensis]MXP32278.1 M20/M25/M40 family metallo-hydrolase [Parerythrobacter jejuensis]